MCKFSTVRKFHSHYPSLKIRCSIDWILEEVIAAQRQSKNQFDSRIERFIILQNGSRW